MIPPLLKRGLVGINLIPNLISLALHHLLPIELFVPQNVLSGDGTFINVSVEAPVPCFITVIRRILLRVPFIPELYGVPDPSVITKS